MSQVSDYFHIFWTTIGDSTFVCMGQKNARTVQQQVCQAPAEFGSASCALKMEMSLDWAVYILCTGICETGDYARQAGLESWRHCWVLPHF
jgi:hypothetical protein